MATAPTSSPDQRITLDEFARLPDNESYELVDGYLKERLVSFQSNVLALRIGAALLNYSDAYSGIACGEGIELAIDPARPQTLLYRADGAFISNGRVPGNEPVAGYLRIPPDLVVEVISPSNTAIEMMAKVEDYLRLGVRLVWLVYPDLKVVNVFTDDASLPSRVRPGQRLEGGDILPGLSIEVDAIFR